MIQSFNIPVKLGGLNEYTKACRTNPHVGAKVKREQQDIVLWAIKAAKLKPMHGKVNVSFVWCEPNMRRDHDNIAFAKKYILDGLVEAGILDGDGWNHVGDFVDEFEIDKFHTGVHVTLIEV